MNRNSANQNSDGHSSSRPDRERWESSLLQLGELAELDAGPNSLLPDSTGSDSAESVSYRRGSSPSESKRRNAMNSRAESHPESLSFQRLRARIFEKSTNDSTPEPAATAVMTSRVGLGTRGRWGGGSVSFLRHAAAAALLLGVALWLVANTPPSVPEQASPSKSIASLPSPLDPNSFGRSDTIALEAPNVFTEIQRDAVQITAEETCRVVALLQSWGDDCHCLDWKVCVESQLEAGEVISIPIPQNGALGEDQKLVIMSSEDLQQLQGSRTSPRELLTCIDTCELDSRNVCQDILPCTPIGVQTLCYNLESGFGE